MMTTETMETAVSDARHPAPPQASLPPLPSGLHRSYSGTVGLHAVSVGEGRDGEWVVNLSVPDAFHDGDDYVARFPDEAAALAAVQAYADTGRLPDAFACQADVREREFEEWERARANGGEGA